MNKSMELSEFLSHVQQNPELSGTFVVAFQGEKAPSSFFSRFFLRAKEDLFPVASLAAEVTSLQDCKARLNVSFLGSRLVYWIQGIEGLSSAQEKQWMLFIKLYQGPHCIMVYDSSRSLVSSETCRVVEIPSTVSISLYKQLGQFLYPEVLFDSYFSQMLFQQQRTLSLENVCMMLEYHRVVGRKCEEFFKEWASKLIVTEHSLFTLAQHFLALQPTYFFQQWNRCGEEYPHEFWIAYWSELMWQAALFVIRATTKGHAEAKKAAYRLPFSFINKDWQKYSADSLIQAHRFLYEFDYKVKQGERSFGLELFFHKFFTGNLSVEAF